MITNKYAGKECSHGHCSFCNKISFSHDSVLSNGVYLTNNAFRNANQQHVFCGCYTTECTDVTVQTHTHTIHI